MRKLWGMVGGLVLLALAGCADICQNGACLQDAAINQEVTHRLDATGALAFDGLTARTYAKVVYLHGIVDTAREQALAEEVALRVPDVVRVVNMTSQRPQFW